MDSKTCGRFRFLPVATAAAAAIPTGPEKNQPTQGESTHTAQELARKDIAIGPPTRAGSPGLGSRVSPPDWVTQNPR